MNFGRARHGSLLPQPFEIFIIQKTKPAPLSCPVASDVQRRSVKAEGWGRGWRRQGQRPGLLDCCQGEGLLPPSELVDGHCWGWMAQLKITVYVLLFKFISFKI